ncbi:MAG: FAD synthetase family protein [Chloroflexota bacterium]
MVLVVDDIDHLRPGLRFVATVGVFDGVHLGHAHVLERLRDLAADLGAAPVAVTFDPHPQAVITGRAPDLICDPLEKLARIADAGAQAIVVQRFDEAFRAQTAEQFLERLARGRDLVGLVMSHESAFGRDRQGTVDTVRRLAARDGFRLVEVDTLEVDGEPVSSSRVRAAVASGNLAAAERLLGRRYAVTGTVACDAGGRWMLTPNGPVVLPPPGAYAVKASWHRADPDDADDTAAVLGSGGGSIPPDQDPMLPGEVALGSATVRDDGAVVLDVQAQPSDARDGVSRAQFVARLGDSSATPASVERALDGAREGEAHVRFEWDEDVPEPLGGWRLPAGFVPPAGGWVVPAEPVGEVPSGLVTATRYVVTWDMEGTSAGLLECSFREFETLDAALDWARQRTTRVALSLPATWPPQPAIRDDGDRWVDFDDWSAGDEPIDGLPEWDGRSPGSG